MRQSDTDPTFTMPVDEPMLDLDGTSADGLDLDRSAQMPGGTVYPGKAVDARELEFGVQPGDVQPGPREDRIPSGVFETTEVELAADQLQGERLPAGVFETTPWEPPPGGVPRLSTMETTPWQPTPGPGAPDPLDPWQQPAAPQPRGSAVSPSSSGARELDLAGVAGSLPEVELPRGPRELDFGDQPSAAATTTLSSAAPAVIPPGDLELAMDPVRPDTGSGTVFEGPPSGVARLDLTPAGPPDASLISGEYKASGISSEFPAPVEGRARFTAMAELFRQVDKAIKMLNLYEGTGESCARQIELAHGHLLETMRAFGNVLLTVTPYEFLLEGEAVYTSEEDRRGITYRLFRDGVRELEILPHISRQEFDDLLQILRVTQANSNEEDSVTQLWERNFTGLRYHAVDFFLEGMIIGESERFQALIEELLREPSRPLHPSEEPVQVARQVMSQLSRELLAQAQQQRSACVHGLSAVDVDGWRASVQQEADSLTQDLWRRTMHVLVRMMEMGRGVETSRVLVQVIGEMMSEGQWTMLGASCKALADVMRQGAVRSPEAIQGLRAALGHLCQGNRLLALSNMLVSCSLSQYHQLGELLRLLPHDADQQLLALTTSTPPGEVQDQLVLLLRERGVDLTDFLGQRLASPNLMHVISAIEELRRLNTAKSVLALRKAAVHPSPRVRLEALRALTEYMDESFAPQLVSALTMGHRDLRDLALTLLERVRVDRQLVAHLIQLARQDEFDDWGPDHRTRLLKMLVRIGGQECDEFLIKTVTALNPLRRKRIETLRREMIRALGETAGRRSQQLLQACLEYRPSRAVRAAIELALRQLEQTP